LLPKEMAFVIERYHLTAQYVAQLASLARCAGIPIGRPETRPLLMWLSTMQVLARLLKGEAPKEIARHWHQPAGG
jgi:hypothetical protein